MCRDCVVKFSFSDKNNLSGRCTKCDLEFDRKRDLINITESGSSFSAHSQVEAKVYKPSF